MMNDKYGRLINVGDRVLRDAIGELFEPGTIVEFLINKRYPKVRVSLDCGLMVDLDPTQIVLRVDR